MKKSLIILFFLTSTGFLYAQVKLYGQYVVGDSREEVSGYERSMRLNGMYYYIEPHFGKNNELCKVRIINYDYVIPSDFHVVLNHAERLVELMEYKYGTASRSTIKKEKIDCGIDTPFLIAYWKKNGKDIQVDIECKDGNYFHIVFTISADSLSTDKRTQTYELVEN